MFENVDWGFLPMVYVMGKHSSLLGSLLGSGVRLYAGLALAGGG